MVDFHATVWIAELASTIPVGLLLSTRLEDFHVAMLTDKYHSAAATLMFF
jgi:hypothetical protein